jgi:hypothetical protein
MRKFAIYPEPHVADPAWVSPVAEMFDDGSVVGYSDSSELLETVLDLHWQLGRNSGKSEEYVRTMQFFENKGWTREQIKEWQFYRQDKSQ